MSATDGPEHEEARALDGVHGVRVAYRVCAAVRRSPATGAVVLLHGLASNLTRWTEFVATTRLATQWDLIRIDLRGHGGSLTRRPIGLDLWCSDLEAILASEGHSDAVLVGHSLGAQVAMQMAVTHPERVRAIALIDPVFDDALRGRWAWIARLRPLLALAASAVRGANALGLHRRCLAPLDLRALDQEARRALSSTHAEAEFMRRYSSTRADLRHVPLAVYLQDLAELFRAAPAPPELVCPLLALISRAGTFADPGVTKQIVSGYAHARIVDIDCQHWPLTERPAEVRAAIEAWCDDLATRDARPATT